MKSNLLRNNRFQKAEYESLRWFAKAEIGTTIKDLLSPGYWANVARDLKRYHEIRVVFEDGSQIVDLLVLEVDSVNKTPVWAKLVVLNIINIAEALATTKEIANKEAKEESNSIQKTPDVSHPDYEIKFRGMAKYSIIRKGDGAVMQEKFNTKEEANLALKALIEKLG